MKRSISKVRLSGTNLTVGDVVGTTMDAVDPAIGNWEARPAIDGGATQAVEDTETATEREWEERQTQEAETAGVEIEI